MPLLLNILRHIEKLFLVAFFLFWFFEVQFHFLFFHYQVWCFPSWRRLFAVLVVVFFFSLLDICCWWVKNTLLKKQEDIDISDIIIHVYWKTFVKIILISLRQLELIFIKWIQKISVPYNGSTMYFKILNVKL